MPGRTVVRRIAAGLLIVLGLSVAFAATHTRSLGARLDESRVVIGESSAAAPDPGNELAFAPFAFGVVGPIESSAGALERAFDVLRDNGGAEFVVLLGDVTQDPAEGELFGLVSTWQEAGVERIAIAGPRDRAHSVEFETYVSPMRWWFRRNGCLFVGVSGDEGDVEFAAKAARAADVGAPVFSFSPTDGNVTGLAPTLAFGSQEGSSADGVLVRRVQVFDGGAHAIASWRVARSATLRSLARAFELRLLWPLVAGTLGFVLVLLACTAAVGQGFRLMRAPAA